MSEASGAIDCVEEIVKGKLVRIQLGSLGHSDLVQYLQSLLIGQLNQGQFHIVTSNFGLGIIPGKRATVRSPDLCVFDRNEWLAGRKATPDSYIWTAPKLIVECLSPSNRKGSQFALLDDTTG